MSDARRRGPRGHIDRTVPLPADDVAALKRIAAARGVRYGELVREAVAAFLELERTKAGPLFASVQRSITYYRPIAPPIRAVDRVLGLFADVADDVDEITREAMRARGHAAEPCAFCSAEPVADELDDPIAAAAGACVSCSSSR